MKRAIKKAKANEVAKKKLRLRLLAVSVVALLIKLCVVIRIEGFDWYQAGDGDLSSGLGLLLDNNLVPPNAWYGADGENYIRGLQGLVRDGIFSGEGKLSYWPAGYPILLWPLIVIFKSYFFMALAILQSFLYALACIWFVDEVRKTRLVKFAFPLALLLSFNPTLALNTLSVGYESPTASLTLISIAALIRYFTENKDAFISIEVLISSLAFTLATFMQPRLLALALAFFFIWAIAKFRLMLAIPFLIVTMGLVLLAPTFLASRNQEVNGYAAISTNLGVTMRLGAGPETSGGYSNQASGLVECPDVEGNAAQVDRAIVRCVIAWYLDNPKITLKLLWNKARFFWSPWFGPEANGTMARNPWNQIHPLRDTVQSQEGFNLVFGSLGKLVSWLWMILGVLFLVRGFTVLWVMGDLEQLLGIVCLACFSLNLFISMFTIGDHRFRLPTMGLSLFLQTIGFLSMYRKKRISSSRGTPLVLWPSMSKRVSGEGSNSL